MPARDPIAVSAHQRRRPGSVQSQMAANAADVRQALGASERRMVREARAAADLAGVGKTQVTAHKRAHPLARFSEFIAPQVVDQVVGQAAGQAAGHAAQATAHAADQQESPEIRLARVVAHLAREREAARAKAERWAAGGRKLPSRRRRRVVARRA